MQESPGLKPDWFGEIRLLAVKNTKHFFVNYSLKHIAKYWD